MVPYKSFLYLALVSLCLTIGCYKDDPPIDPDQNPDCTAFGLPLIDTLLLPQKDQSNGVIILVPTPNVEFSLNDTLYQIANRFSGLAEGNYTLYMKGAQGCRSSLPISLNGQPEIQWVFPMEGDTVQTPFTVEYLKWNWENIQGEREIRLYRNDTLVKTQVLDLDTMVIESHPEGSATWSLGLWDVVQARVIARSTISFRIKENRFYLKVRGGTGSGFYLLGEQVFVEGKRKPGLEFRNWGGDSTYLMDPFSANTSLFMPDHDMTIESQYKIVDTIYYSSQVEPIINTSCALKDCHDHNSNNSDLSDFSVVRSKATEIKTMVLDRSMPLAPDTLSQAEIDLIVKWVNQGALDN